MIPAAILPRQWIVPRMVPRDRVADQVRAFIAELDAGKGWTVTVEERKPLRSHQQNRYLWAIYDYILKVGGEVMAGWDKEDLHTFFLGEHNGWEVRELFGRKRNVPVKRSSKMNKQEFTDYVAFIQRYMAERGVVIPDPEVAHDF